MINSRARSVSHPLSRTTSPRDVQPITHLSSIQRMVTSIFGLRSSTNRAQNSLKIQSFWNKTSLTWKTKRKQKRNGMRWSRCDWTSLLMSSSHGILNRTWKMVKRRNSRAGSLQIGRELMFWLLLFVCQAHRPDELVSLLYTAPRTVSWSIDMTPSPPFIRSFSSGRLLVPALLHSTCPIPLGMGNAKSDRLPGHLLLHHGRSKSRKSVTTPRIYNLTWSLRALVRRKCECWKLIGTLSEGEHRPCLQPIATKLIRLLLRQERQWRMAISTTAMRCELSVMTVIIITADGTTNPDEARRVAIGNKQTRRGPA